MCLSKQTTVNTCTNTTVLINIKSSQYTGCGKKVNPLYVFAAFSATVEKFIVNIRQVMHTTLQCFDAVG